MSGSKKTTEKLIAELAAAHQRIAALEAGAADCTVAAEMLEQSRFFAKSTLDGLSANIALLDDQGNILLVNKAWREFAQQNGLPPESVSEGTNYLQACDIAAGENSEEAVPFAEGIRMVLAGVRDFFQLEYPCDAPDQKRWFAGRVTPFPGSGPRRVIVAHEDITERKQAEEALRESDARFRGITEASPNGIVMMDPNGLVSFWNPAAELLFGYSSGEAIGQNLHQLIAPERYHKSFKAAHSIFLDTGQGNAIGKTLDLTARRRGGEEIFVSLSLASLNMAGVWHAVGIIRDVTELRRLEQIKDDVERIVRHNLKTPLTGLINLPQLLAEDENLTHDQRDMLGMIEASGKKMLRQINNSLELYKIECGTYQLKASTCDPVLVLRDNINILAKGMRLAPEQVIIRDLSASTGGKDSSIKTDELLLNIVVMNLLGNALEASDKDARVFVDLYKDEHEFTIAISNSQSVPVEIRDKFFEKYVTAGKIGGTGLGTYSAAIITKALGGTIEMETSDETGTKVTVHIPMTA